MFEKENDKIFAFLIKINIIAIEIKRNKTKFNLSYNFNNKKYLLKLPSGSKENNIFFKFRFMKNTLQVIKYTDDYDYRSMQKLLLNWKVIHDVYDLTDCPEDAIIWRDLTSSNDVLNIINIILNTDWEFEILPMIEAETKDIFDKYK